MPLCRTVLLLAAALVAPLAQAQSISTTPCIPEPGSAQSSAIPSLTYDVASIRLIKSSDGSMSFRDSAHEAKLTVTGVTMRNLIENAFKVSTFIQVIGGPGWLDNDRFDIQAKSDDTVSAQLLKLNDCDARQAKQKMLQALLADRIKLTVHHVTKEVSGYDLVLAKNGPKLQVLKPDPPATDQDDKAKPTGCSMSMRGIKNGTQISAKNCSMLSLALQLLFDADTPPVEDKTGLTGTYDFKLQYSQQDSAAQESSQNAPYPELFTALEEQLGLKLQRAKVTVDTLVIDHVEKPTEN
jgi:uncharacterized protein (TIGR03435 family)